MNKTSTRWAEQVLADLSRAIHYRLQGMQEFTDYDGLAFGGTSSEGGNGLGARVVMGKGSGFAPLEQGKILRAYLQSKRRLLVFDYGGTLKGIESMNKEYKVNSKQVQLAMPSRTTMLVTWLASHLLTAYSSPNAHHVYCRCSSCAPCNCRSPVHGLVTVCLLRCTSLPPMSSTTMS
jgi:hypothetical protein